MCMDVSIEFCRLDESGSFQLVMFLVLALTVVLVHVITGLTRSAVLVLHSSALCTGSVRFTKF